MKKLLIIPLLFLLAGCGKETVLQSAQATVNDSNSNSITVTGPMTISTNDLYSVTHKNDKLNLQLVKGRYYEDWSPSPFYGRGWSGDFQIVITDEYGEVKSTFPLNEHFTNDLIFNDFFQIEFDDYNGDGQADFTIGQYGTSNGYFFKIFSITDDDHIKELPVSGNPELFISAGNGRYSTKLEKIDEITIKKSSYDNSIGKDVEVTLRWDGTEFVRLDSR
ncbi:hypothetical protein [Cohnella herbarum]|uniref:Lipoprotein n=1 Tax=Cohnella herbarum TaxID=2728023 RepID=A0A7Z2ZKU7_9BACL|nr:hypothetical protein [Cohnella herbarum]QJD83210.1 hypothetical protein HH215_08505 [Cohnella herbarum]